MGIQETFKGEFSVSRDKSVKLYLQKTKIYDKDNRISMVKWMCILFL